MLRKLCNLKNVNIKDTLYIFIKYLNQAIAIKIYKLFLDNIY